MSAAYINNLVTLIAIFSILGVSFNLLMGYTGLFSISHGAFFGAGAYTTGILMRDHGWTFLAAAAAAFLLCGVFSLIVGVASSRVTDFYLVIMTLGLQIAAVELFGILDVTGGASGLVGIPRADLFGAQLTNQQMVVFSWVCAGIVFGYVRYLVRSPFGRALQTVRENSLAAGSLGLSVMWLKVRAFALSSALAGFAGALFAVQVRYISPHEFNLERSIEVLSMVIIGGLAAMYGPLIGSLVVVGVPAALTFLDLPTSVVGAVNAVLFSLAVLAFLLFRPRGVLGPDGGRRRSGRGTGKRDHSSGQRALTDLMADGSGGPVRLEARGVGVSFGGLRALDGVDLGLEPGTITGLVGPNGAGKTTLFNVISGVVKPDAGDVLVNGRSVARSPIHERARRRVVRSFQDMKLYDGMTVLDNVVSAVTPAGDLRVVRLAGGRRERDRVGRALALLDAVGLEGKEDVLARDLSYAEQKLLMLARLFATGAGCFLLDEPMSGLDTQARERIQALLVEAAEAGATICLVEHSLDVIAGTCGRVAFLSEGSLVREGETAEITTDPELVDMYFGV